MAKQNLLTDKKISSAKCPQGKSFIYLNDGSGLRLKVYEDGRKLWRFRIVYDGKESTSSFGSYPTVSLADARNKASISRLQLSNGFNPIQEKKRQRRVIAQSYQNTFKDVAEEALVHYANRQERPWSAKHIERSKGILKNYVYKKLGSVPMSQIDHVAILEVLKGIHNKGVYRTALHAKNVISSIFTYAIHSNKATQNPTDVLRKNTLLTRPEPNHLRTIEIAEIGRFFCTLEASTTLHIVTKSALKLIVYTALRVNSIRQAKWEWIDKAGTMTVPAAFMKNRKDFKIPLPSQALEIINQLRPLNYRGEASYIFQAGTKPQPISENTTTVAIKKLGFDATSHGMRTLMKRVLTKENRYPYDAIERQLDHKRPKLESAYMGGEDWLDVRREMLAWYADWLEEQVEKYVEGE
jgi:integrase